MEGKRNEEDFHGSDGSCVCVLGRGLRGSGGEGGGSGGGPGSGEGPCGGSGAAEKAPAAKKASKPKAKKVTGTIEELDAAAGTFTVKGKKGDVNLKAGEKVKLGDFKVGDKVVVKYAGGTASSVKAAEAKKAKAKADAKPAAEKKATPAAAPAAAPAMPAEKK